MKLETPANTSHVKAGVLVASSASAIESFDVASTWGCERKWWLEQVAGQRTPPDASQAKGEAIHKQIEHYLFTKENKLGPEAMAGKGDLDAIVTRATTYQLEQWLPKDFAIYGVNIRGRMDFLARNPDGQISEIWDWKTTSSIEKYAKLPHQLAGNTQMLVYRAAAEEMGCEPELRMGWLFLGTKKREAEAVAGKITREMLFTGLGNISRVLSKMKDVAKATDSEDVAPDRSKCDIGRGCPHRSHCMKGTPMASLLERLKAQSTPAPVVAVTPSDAPPPAPVVVDTPPPPPPPPPAPVAPPPAAPAAPAEEAVVPAAPKRGPGRPPGAPNKPKVAAPVAVTVPEGDMAIVEVTMTVGATVNLGNYQSARVDLSAKAVLNKMDLTTAREALDKQLTAELEKALEKYMTKA